MNIRVTFKTRTYFGTEYENHLDIGDNIATGAQVLSPAAARQLGNRLHEAAKLAERAAELEADIADCSAVIDSGHPVKTEPTPAPECPTPADL